MLSIITAPKYFVNTHLTEKVLTCNTYSRTTYKDKTPAALVCRRFVILTHILIRQFNKISDQISNQ